jgi:hypothetical protein
MTSTLKSAFTKLAGMSINIGDYVGSLHEVAFDLCYTDSFIAGIADRILSGEPISRQERAVIHKPFILDETYWASTEGLYVDLSNHEKLLEIAKQIEEVRQICARMV